MTRRCGLGGGGGAASDQSDTNTTPVVMQRTPRKKNGQHMTGFMGQEKMEIVKKFYRDNYMTTEVCSVDAYV